MPHLHKLSRDETCLLTDRHVVHRTKWGITILIFCTSGGGRKLGEKACPRPWFNAWHLLAAYAGVLGIAHNKIFLFPDGIDQVYPADPPEVLYRMFRVGKLIIKSARFLFRIIYHRELQR